MSPYIKKSDRDKFGPIEMLGLKAGNPGELNYLFSMIIKGYLNRKGLMRYQEINDVLGALEGCKLELYRRRCSGYEDLKIQENGDI